MKLGNIWRESRLEPVVGVPGGLVEVNRLARPALAALDDLWRRPGLLDRLRESFQAFAAAGYFDIRECIVRKDRVRFTSPVTDPEKIICIGRLTNQFV